MYQIRRIGKAIFGRVVPQEIDVRIVILGEAMLELSRRGDHWSLGYGGDTLNIALHLVRFGREVAYATALGTDPFAADLRLAWAEEGIDLSLILTDPDRRTGLYAITTDAVGERSFTYWRDNSAARRLFALPDADRVVLGAGQADLLIFSLISLAILPHEGRAALLDLARQVRHRGGRVAFDGNYRPALWSDTAEALAVRDAALAVTDIGLPTIDDEIALSGEGDAGTIAARWCAQGVREVVVKLGDAGCWVDGVVVPPPASLKPVDTSGAGDAFNAGYLHARLAGQCPRHAAEVGHRLAGWVVMRTGAVPLRSLDAPYAGLTITAGGDKLVG